MSSFTRTPASSAADAAKSWRSSLPPERRRSADLRGGALFLVSAAFYVAFFAGTFLLPWPAARVACLFAVPMVIGSLFVIGHDAAHNSLTRSGWLNRLLGRLALLPAWHPYTSWCHAHNTLHHGGTNLKGRHPDFPPFSKAEFDALPWWRRALERVYRTPLGVGLFYTIDFYGRFILLPSAKNAPPFALRFQLDRLLVLAFVALQSWAAWELAAYTPNPALPRFWVALIGVVVPWVTWIWFMGFVSYIQHTHPSSAWYDNPNEWSFYHVQLRSTTHVVFPWPIEGMLNNIMDHPAHHIDPTIPLYELPPSQKELEQSAPEHSLVVKWSLGEYLRTCRACKLYDYKRHCWLDFDGKPTTEEGLNAPPKMRERA